MDHGGLQHVGHLYVIVYIVGDVGALQSIVLSFYIQALHLTVQSVTHQFQGDVRVTKDTW